MMSFDGSGAAAPGCHGGAAAIAWSVGLDATLREAGRSVRTLPPGTGALEAEAAGAALALGLLWSVPSEDRHARILGDAPC
eukprot:13894185-Alexandrium_andersonii.AAC.1